MKLQTTGWLIVVSFALLQNAFGQSFINLDFEDATIVPDPSGPFYPYSVYASDAMPGWTGYLGTQQVTDVLYNDFTLGNASIGIVGPASVGVGIEGQYTVVLQPGANPFGSGNVGASISQSGLVPANAQSIQFKAVVYPPFVSDFSVSFAGHDLPLIALGSGPNYTLYGADISAFSGQAGALTISTVAQANIAPYYFDSIVFSPSSVPEPSTIGLLALSGLCFSLRRSQ